MSIFEKIAERKIEQAIAKGEFDNLANKGKPLPPDDMEMVPEDLRMAYKILKNAGIVPEEIELQKSIVSLTGLLNACADEDERKIIRAKLNEKMLRYNIIMESRGLKKLDPYYSEKIMDKLK
jgi:formylmethanofuran dehydrogenase subunit A